MSTPPTHPHSLCCWEIPGNACRSCCVCGSRPSQSPEKTGAVVPVPGSAGGLSEADRDALGSMRVAAIAFTSAIVGGLVGSGYVIYLWNAM